MKHGFLYLVGQLGPGGLERQLYYLLQALDRARHQPFVIVWNDCEQDMYTAPLRALGVPVYSLPRTVSPLGKLATLRRIIVERQPAVAHSYSFYTNVAVYWATLGTNTIAIGSVRGDFAWTKHESGRWLGNLSARWPRAQVCNSVAAFETAQHSRHPFVPQRLFVVRNGIDLTRFHPAAQSNRKQVCLVGIGSLLPVKRWDRLFHAAAVLKQRGLRFLVQLVGDGPLQQSLRQQVQALGITDCVDFLGTRTDVPRILAEATALVHTSDSEGCPNAVMEAMACGRPVVATAVGDIPLLVEGGKTGFVVPREHDVALVDRLTTLLTDPALCQRMGDAGRVKAEQEFGLDRLVNETLMVYRATGWNRSDPQKAPTLE